MAVLIRRVTAEECEQERDEALSAVGMTLDDWRADRAATCCYSCMVADHDGDRFGPWGVIETAEYLLGAPWKAER